MHFAKKPLAAQTNAIIAKLSKIQATPLTPLSNYSLHKGPCWSPRIQLGKKSERSLASQPSIFFKDTRQHAPAKRTSNHRLLEIRNANWVYLKMGNGQKGCFNFGFPTLWFGLPLVSRPSKKKTHSHDLFYSAKGPAQNMDEAPPRPAPR